LGWTAWGAGALAPLRDGSDVIWRAIRDASDLEKLGFVTLVVVLVSVALVSRTARN
jgi:hypothetical protein